MDSLATHRVGQLDQFQNWDKFNEQAFDLIASDKAREAFNLDNETDEMRDLYGRSRLGDRCLTARRLVEAGVRFVTVGDDSWDHHSNIFKLLESGNRLPQFDQAFAGLVGDLEQRGLLDETLLIYFTEFGRTPRVNQNAGRDHWPGVFSVAFAGAGVQAGQVIGSSDRTGAGPLERPISAEDLATTIFTMLGINPRKEVLGSGNRPFMFTTGGSVIDELLA